MKRTETRKIKVGNISIGGSNNVLIQSMCDIKTSHVKEVIAQINDCARLGASLMRVAVLDEEDAHSISKIKEQINIPLIADIHFDYRLALIVIEEGIDAIRINPGNIGSVDKIKLVVDACKKNHVPIRVGVNSGSVDKTILKVGEKLTPNHLVESAKKHVKILEDLDFHDIVISLKGSNVLDTIKAYELASEIFPYPLHLGITEAGIKDIGVIRSVAGLSPLLLEGIGDTIRISLTDTPQEEIITAKRLLHDLGLYPNYPTLISCPTCGRTQVDVRKVAETTMKHLEYINKPVTVAVMGCVVNGPGEARHADIGIAGGKNTWAIFKKGKVDKVVSEKEIIPVLLEEIDKL